MKPKKIDIPSVMAFATKNNFELTQEIIIYYYKPFLSIYWAIKDYMKNIDNMNIYKDECDNLIVVIKSKNESIKNKIIEMLSKNECFLDVETTTNIKITIEKEEENE